MKKILTLVMLVALTFTLPAFAHDEEILNLSGRWGFIYSDGGLVHPDGSINFLSGHILLELRGPIILDDDSILYEGWVVGAHRSSVKLSYDPKGDTAWSMDIEITVPQEVFGFIFYDEFSASVTLLDSSLYEDNRFSGVLSGKLIDDPDKNEATRADQKKVSGLYYGSVFMSHFENVKG